jgi:hypothetical protein
MAPLVMETGPEESVSAKQIRPKGRRAAGISFVYTFGAGIRMGWRAGGCDSLRYSTVNGRRDAAVPFMVVTVILPLVAPVGTVAEINCLLTL